MPSVTDGIQGLAETDQTSVSSTTRQMIAWTLFLHIAKPPHSDHPNSMKIDLITFLGGATSASTTCPSTAPGRVWSLLLQKEPLGQERTPTVKTTWPFTPIPINVFHGQAGNSVGRSNTAQHWTVTLSLLLCGPTRIPTVGILNSLQLATGRR